jgi:hypothetical protein
MKDLASSRHGGTDNERLLKDNEDRIRAKGKGALDQGTGCLDSRDCEGRGGQQRERWWRFRRRRDMRMWGRWRADGRYDADGGRWNYTHNEKSGDKESSAASLILEKLPEKHQAGALFTLDMRLARLLLRR